MLELSFSSISSFQRCARLWGLHYTEQVRPVPGRGARPLMFGTAYHAAQEVLWGGQTDAKVGQVWRDAAASEGLCADDTVLGEILLAGYRAYWEQDQHDYTAIQPLTEARVDVPVLDLDGNELPGVRLRGILDAVAITRDGRNLPVEHKTTMSDITDGSWYWRRLALNQQASTYLLLCHWLHRSADRVLWDVVRAPPYRRLKATEPTARKYRKDGGLYNNQRAESESEDEFRARVTAKVLESPGEYFMRREIFVTPDDLRQAHIDLLDQIRIIQYAVEHGLYPRNPQSCHDYQSECAYLPLCTGQARATDGHLYSIGKDTEHVLTDQDL